MISDPNIGIYSEITIILIFITNFIFNLKEDLQCYSKSANSQLIGFPDLGRAEYIYQDRHGNILNIFCLIHSLHLLYDMEFKKIVCFEVP